MASIRFQTGGAPTLADGAMGTALLARGLAQGAIPEEWLLTRPEAIAEIHAEHAAAGARILLTCTFNAASPRLDARVDPDRLEALCGWAERLARGAARGALVAGALGPTGLAVPGGPDRSRAPVEAAARVGRAARALATAGVDLLWLETQWDLAEARAALRAARETGLPVVVTFTLRAAGTALIAPDGTRAEALLAAVAGAGASAAGVNCVEAGPALGALASWARGGLGIPLAVKPSAGLPGAVLTPAAFAAAIRPAVEGGAALVGGCCGAGGEHLRAVAALAGDQAGGAARG